MTAARYRALLDHLGVAAALLDARGRFLYANPALARLLDRPPAALRGQALARHLAAGSLRPWARRLRRPEGRPALELRLRPRRGPLCPVVLGIRGEGEGARRVLLAEFTVRRPRPPQEALSASSRLHRALLRDVSEAIVVCDEGGRLLRANPAACRLAGGNPVGKAFDQAFPLGSVGRPDAAAFHRAKLSALLRQGGVLRREALLPGPDGAARRLLVSARPVRLEKRRPRVVVVVLTDVSESRRFEEELKNANTTLQRRVHERTANLLLLYDLARTANEAESTGQALILALERIGRHGGWQSGLAYLRSGTDPAELSVEAAWTSEDVVRRPGLDVPPSPDPGPASRDPVLRALRSGRIELSRRLERDLGRRGRDARRAGLRSAIAVPIRRGTDILGVLEFFSPALREVDDAERATLDAAGLQLGEIVDRKRLQKEFVEAVSHEHERIRRELHDSVGQELTGLSLMMHAFPAGGRKRAAAASEIAQGIQRVLRGVHDLSRGVFPAEISSLGLAGALARLAEETRKRSGLQCRFRDGTRGAVLNPRTSLQVFRIAQEAVNNAVKHSRGRRIAVSLGKKDGIFRLEILDDGRGVPAASPGSGAGLRTMRFRAEAIGGTLRIRRSAGGGTHVACVWKA